MDCKSVINRFPVAIDFSTYSSIVSVLIICSFFNFVIAEFFVFLVVALSTDVEEKAFLVFTLFCSVPFGFVVGFFGGLLVFLVGCWVFCVVLLVFF